MSGSHKFSEKSVIPITNSGQYACTRLNIKQPRQVLRRSLTRAEAGLELCKLRDHPSKMIHLPIHSELSIPYSCFHQEFSESVAMLEETYDLLQFLDVFIFNFSHKYSSLSHCDCSRFGTDIVWRFSIQSD